ncbi:hypothetical protein ACFYOV_32880 [Streptomyces sp. NPDC005931]|uniref:hypothetical protein n=1 Tax=Streptomyces sp. NPDC005931 TaxID=3364737 RepID=UPI0036980FE0
MTPALRYGHTSTATAITFTAAAAGLAATPYWPAALALLYTAALFTWLAVRCYADHRRILLEHDWARRRALGEQPAPRDPCCRLGRASRGAAHDHRCTDLTTRHADDPRSEA